MQSLAKQLILQQNDASKRGRVMECAIFPITLSLPHRASLLLKVAEDRSGAVAIAQVKGMYYAISGLQRVAQGGALIPASFMTSCAKRTPSQN